MSPCRAGGEPGQTATFDSRQAVTSIGTATYDAFNQGNAETLTRANPAATWTSASLGLMSQTAGSTTHLFTRDTRGNVLAARQGTARLYYVLDATSSVIGVFDAAGAFIGGYSYSPYGELRSATTNTTIQANPLRFTGGLWDAAVGLYRFGARYYDPALGRFTQHDPSGQEQNTYLYAWGNPVNYIDTTGTIPAVVPLLVAGAVRAAPSIVRAFSYRSVTATRSRSAAEAVSRARAEAASGGARCVYRGPCSRGDHVHVDYYNNRSQLLQTTHYNW